MRAQVSIIGLIIALICSCEYNKENDNEKLSQIDTVFPLDYLPAYPGSYWVYDNMDTIKSANEYILASIFNPVDDHYPNNGCFAIDTSYFPVYDNKILSGYATYSIDSSCSNNEILLSENEGYCWTDLSGFHFFITSRYVVKKDTSIQLPNNIFYDSIKVVSNRTYDYRIDMLSNIVEDYYAKNIGLVGSKIIFDSLNGIKNPIWIKYLVKYHINK